MVGEVPGLSIRRIARYRQAVHLVTLSFDDGFERSCLRVAELYEARGLSACFNVIATGHEPDFRAPDEWQEGVRRGDFGLWRELRERGHEVMPHGFRHENLMFLPHDDAVNLVDRCLARFAAEFPDWSESEVVFNYPYNLSTPQLDEHLLARVRAVRVMGVTGINPLPSAELNRIEAVAYGPDSCDDHLETSIEKLLAGPPAWLVYNTHGVDGEGWGPVSSDRLAAVLDRLLEHGARILPTAGALHAS